MKRDGIQFDRSLAIELEGRLDVTGDVGTMTSLDDLLEKLFGIVCYPFGMCNPSPSATSDTPMSSPRTIAGVDTGGFAEAR